MENIAIRKTDRGLHIDGYPDAVRAIQLEGREARQLAHYVLHKSDLEFALSCLDRINITDDEIVRSALWRSAIIYFIKCFKSSAARSQLQRNSVYLGDEIAKEVFAFFDHIRNKHIVHDENALISATCGAAINGGNKPFKVEKILALSMRGEVLGQENFSNLHLLITTAMKWVTQKFDFLCDQITEDLEREPIEKLLARPEMISTTPTTERLDSRRAGL